MAAFLHWTRSFAWLSLFAAASTAMAQVPSPPAATQPTAGITSPAHYGAPSPQPAPPIPEYAARPSLAVRSPRALPPVKPFEMTPPRPTVSPYLQLHRDDLDESLPNYFAFVLPQLQQQQQLHRQQVELERMHRRLQSAGRGAAAAEPSAGGVDGQPFNYHARFLNTGGYYNGVRQPQQKADVAVD